MHVWVIHIYLAKTFPGIRMSCRGYGMAGTPVQQVETATIQSSTFHIFWLRNVATKILSA